MLKRNILGGLLAGSAMLLAMAPQVAAAQEIRDLDREASNVRTFAGTLGEDGPALFEASIPAGSALRIDVIATTGFDPMVAVTDATSGEQLAMDDDSGSELNARVTIPGAAGRRVRIAVSAFVGAGYGEEPAAEERGSYGSPEIAPEYTENARNFDLRLTTLTYTPQAVRSIGWGTAAGGTLLGEETHEFTFQGEAGKVLDVVMLAGEGSGLDPYLQLQGANGEVIATNDDSGGGLNARLRHVMQDSGIYTIIASAFGGSSGDYTLRVGERREAVMQAPVQVIDLGEPAEGVLGEGYENGGIEPAFIDYQLSEALITAIAAGGGQVTIHMEKAAGANDDPAFGNGLDPLVEIGFDTPLGFAPVDSDDDSAGDANAMLPIDLSSLRADRALLGRLRIRAKSLNGAGGAYVLRVTEGMEARAAETAEYD